jgi:NAD+ synthase
MKKVMRISLAQFNPTVGDFKGNFKKTQDAVKQARASDVLVFPEMFLCGYQTQDLILKPAFIKTAQQTVEELTRHAKGVAIVVGAPYLDDGVLYNALYVLQDSTVKDIVCKRELPNYGVFDEKRLFASASSPSGLVEIDGLKIGFGICEDFWTDTIPQSLQDADIYIVPNGSPFERDKHAIRQYVMAEHALKPLIYLNMVGGQDDQVFDGGSFILHAGGDVAMQAPFFTENLIHTDWGKVEDTWVCQTTDSVEVPDDLELTWQALCVGLRDYVLKNGFQKVLLGLSGGVDSAIVATIAVDALGAQNVRCVVLPSKFTSQESLDDGLEVIKRLGVSYDTLSIESAVDTVEQTLAPLFQGYTPDLTEENIQSRLRGLYLMALSNKFGELLLTTGNKSEVAVGYSTLYGDMAGAFNPIKDVYKTDVFALCRWRNDNHRDWMQGAKGTVIPENIITKPPTAELRENQKDEDSLPPYETLDAILQMLIEEDASVADVVAMGFEKEVVQKVEQLVYQSEYKRFQSAPGTKVSNRAFWLDRRYPMTNKFRDKL